MPAEKKKTQKKKNRCWPGYEPVPGKARHSPGSCRPKSKKKSLTAGEKDFRAARERQLKKWQKDHPSSPRKAAQHLPAPRTRTRKKVA